MFQIIVAGVALFFACNGSQEEEGPVRDMLPTEGEGESEGEVPVRKDAGIQLDQGPGTRDYGLITPDATVEADAYTPPVDMGPDAAPDAAPDAGVPPPLRPDVNIISGTRIAFFLQDFDYWEGYLCTADLAPISEAVCNEDPIDSADVLLRNQEEKIYAINRSNASIHVHDSDRTLLGSYSVGLGSNPEDLVVMPGETKAYVSRVDAHNDTENDDDILIIDPNTGDLIDDGIDLTEYATNEDELARAAQMVLVGAELYCILRNYDLSYSYSGGKVIVVNTTTDEVTDEIELEGDNPADITYSEVLDKVFVTNTGDYSGPDASSIETIDPTTKESEGLQITGTELGGILSEIRLGSNSEGYVITATDWINYKIAFFDPSTMSVIDTEFYQSLGTFLPDFSIDASGRLVVAERGSTPEETGIVVDGTLIPTTLWVGAVTMMP